MEKAEKKKRINKIGLCLFLGGVLLLFGAVSYAYFTAQTTNQGVGVTTVSQTVEYEGTELVTKGEIEFSDTGILPGHKNVSSISVTATGLNNVIYNLNWTGTNSLNTPLTYTVYKTATKETPSITCNRKTEVVTGETRYSEECTESGFDNLGEAIGTGTIGTSEVQTKVNLVINEEIQATREGSTVYYYVVLEYPNLEEPQNSDMGGSFSGIVNTEILGSKEEPIVEMASVEATESSNGWYSSVTVTARASNSNNTVSAVNSCITTEEECTPQASRSVGVIEKSVTLNESNKLPQKVCFQAVDKNGVTGNIMCSNSYLIDNTSTTTSITLNESSVLGDNNWYQSLTLDIKGNNEISGINSLKYCITSTDECVPDQEVNGVNTSVTLESSAVGQKVCAVSLDNKGTTSEVACSNLYNVDTVNPVVSINNDYTVTENSITVSVTASDEDSKITSYNYTLNGSAYSSCIASSCTFTGLTGGTEYTVGISVSDVSGRKSTVVSKVIKTKSEVKDTILANKTITAMPSITGISSDTSNTLYTVADDDGTSYVFRGNPSNNWVSFGGFYWRIIRVNGDGTIRMIYNGTSTATTGTGTQITLDGVNLDGIGNNYSYSGGDRDNTFIGYMYGGTADTYEETHENNFDSKIKNYLDTWYKSNLVDYDKYIDINAGFCNDRQPQRVNASSYGILGYQREDTVYRAGAKFYTWSSASYAESATTQIPTLICSQTNDLFTMAGAKKGNKALDYPIGLITADEVLMAGGFVGENNNSFYLYTGQTYWTMTPAHFFNTTPYVFSVTEGGGVNGSHGVKSPKGIRPVINLRSDVTLTGSGLATDPYLISGKILENN